MTALLTSFVPQSLFGFGPGKIAEAETPVAQIQSEARVNREELTDLFSDILSQQDIRRVA